MGHSIQQCHRLNSTQPQVKLGYQSKNFTKQAVQKHKDAYVFLVSQKVTTMIESLQSKDNKHTTKNQASTSHSPDMGVVNTDLTLCKKQVQSLNEQVTDSDVLAVEDEAPLTLHNAFDMLVPESDNGEALWIDLNTESPYAGQLAAKQIVDLAIPIDVCLVTNIDSEVPIPSGSRHAATMITIASAHRALGPADVSRWAPMHVLSPVPLHVPQNKEQLVCNITKQVDTNILQANNKLFNIAVYPSATVLLDKVISD